MSDIVKYTILYGILMGVIFTVVFVLFGKPLGAIFLQDSVLIEQTAYFLKILTSVICESSLKAEKLFYSF